VSWSYLDAKVLKAELGNGNGAEERRLWQVRLLLVLSFLKACERRMVALKRLLGSHSLAFRSLKEHLSALRAGPRVGRYLLVPHGWCLSVLKPLGDALVNHQRFTELGHRLAPSELSWPRGWSPISPSKTLAPTLHCGPGLMPICASGAFPGTQAVSHLFPQKLGTSIPLQPLIRMVFALFQDNAIFMFSN